MSQPASTTPKAEEKSACPHHDDVTIVMVAYHSGALIASALNGLIATGAKVCVVDNASEASLKQVCQQRGVGYTAMDKNVGFGCASNEGVKQSETQYICLLNPDAELSGEALSALKTALVSTPDAAIAGPKLITNGKVFFKNNSLLNPPNKTARKEGIWTSKNAPETQQKVLNLSGACLFFEKKRFEEIGGFDDQIFLFYEDDDLCRRMRDKGWHLIYTPDAIVPHLGAKSSPDKQAQIELKSKMLIQSECYVRKKYNLPPISSMKKVIFLLKGYIYSILKNKEKMTKYRAYLDVCS